jgi:hypothetical protein
MMRGEDWDLTFNHLDGKQMTERKPDQTIMFKLFDDDGVLYFTGYMTPDLYDSEYIFNPLDYSMEVWGCTELRCKNPVTKKWETI